jgi:hypothetical protein
MLYELPMSSVPADGACVGWRGHNQMRLFFLSYERHARLPHDVQLQLCLLQSSDDHEQGREDGDRG